MLKTIPKFVIIAFTLHAISWEEQKETEVIVNIHNNVVQIHNVKLEGQTEGVGDSRERIKSFSFDYAYNSLNPTAPGYASQELIFQDLGTDVLQASFEGFNTCVFAYGQTGSGKTYTMMGNPPGEVGLIPRMCENLFTRIHDLCEEVEEEERVSFNVSVSYLEIYNERVRDLLCAPVSPDEEKYTLKVREHPKDGPFVDGLSKHAVKDNKAMQAFIKRGNEKRTTAATHYHDRSSRSHAIFTITFTQSKYDEASQLPSEKVSKINLVDLAGSERADPNSHYNKGRLKEGANINKSLVTLGNVIQSLAERSLLEWSQRQDSMLGSSLSLYSPDGSRESLSSSSPVTSTPMGRKSKLYIPYRDSVLTWLLKDSLGGNSKTIMIATVSPSDMYFTETLGTLRYAQRAKSIMNKPVVNEDVNVSLIRELKEEVGRLKVLLAAKWPDRSNSVSTQAGSMSSVSETSSCIAEKMENYEVRAKELTNQWLVDRWQETQEIMKDPYFKMHIKRVSRRSNSLPGSASDGARPNRESDMSINPIHLGRRSSSMGVIVDSHLPHLIAMDDDILSTGVVMYHLKEGKTQVGHETAGKELDIYLNGQDIQHEHCVIRHVNGDVVLYPNPEAFVKVNERIMDQPVHLSQGDIIFLGKSNMFRFNNPMQAAKLRQSRKAQYGDTRLPGALSRWSSMGSMSTPSSSGSTLDSYTGGSLPVSPVIKKGVDMERSHGTEEEKIQKARTEIEKLQYEKHKAEDSRQEKEDELWRLHEKHKSELEAEKEALRRRIQEFEEERAQAELDLEERRRQLDEDSAQREEQLAAKYKTLEELEQRHQEEITRATQNFPIATMPDLGSLALQTESQMSYAARSGLTTESQELVVFKANLQKEEDSYMHSKVDDEERLKQKQLELEEMFLTESEKLELEKRRLKEKEKSYQSHDASLFQSMASQTDYIEQLEHKKVQLVQYIEAKEQDMQEIGDASARESPVGAAYSAESLRSPRASRKTTKPTSLSLNAIGTDPSRVSQRVTSSSKPPLPSTPTKKDSSPHAGAKPKVTTSVTAQKVTDRLYNAQKIREQATASGIKFHEASKRTKTKTPLYKHNSRPKQRRLQHTNSNSSLASVPETSDELEVESQTVAGLHIANYDKEPVRMRHKAHLRNENRPHSWAAADSVSNRRVMITPSLESSVPEGSMESMLDYDNIDVDVTGESSVVVSDSESVMDPTTQERLAPEGKERTDSLTSCKGPLIPSHIPEIQINMVTDQQRNTVFSEGDQSVHISNTFQHPQASDLQVREFMETSHAATDIPPTSPRQCKSSTSSPATPRKGKKSNASKKPSTSESPPIKKKRPKSATFHDKPQPISRPRTASSTSIHSDFSPKMARSQRTSSDKGLHTGRKNSSSLSPSLGSPQASPKIKIKVPKSPISSTSSETKTNDNKKKSNSSLSKAQSEVHGVEKRPLSGDEVVPSVSDSNKKLKSDEAYDTVTGEASIHNNDDVFQTESTDISGARDINQAVKSDPAISDQTQSLTTESDDVMKDETDGQMMSIKRIKRKKNPKFDGLSTQELHTEYLKSMQRKLNKEEQEKENESDLMSTQELINDYSKMIQRKLKQDDEDSNFSDDSLDNMNVEDFDLVATENCSAVAPAGKKAKLEQEAINSESVPVSSQTMPDNTSASSPVLLPVQPLPCHDEGQDPTSIFSVPTIRLTSAILRSQPVSIQYYFRTSLSKSDTELCNPSVQNDFLGDKGKWSQRPKSADSAKSRPPTEGFSSPDRHHYSPNEDLSVHITATSTPVELQDPAQLEGPSRKNCKYRASRKRQQEQPTESESGQQTDDSLHSGIKSKSNGRPSPATRRRRRQPRSDLTQGRHGRVGMMSSEEYVTSEDGESSFSEDSLHSEERHDPVDVPVAEEARHIVDKVNTMTSALEGETSSLTTHSGTDDVGTVTSALQIGTSSVTTHSGMDEVSTSALEGASLTLDSATKTAVLDTLLEQSVDSLQIKSSTDTPGCSVVLHEGHEAEHDKSSNVGPELIIEEETQNTSTDSIDCSIKETSTSLLPGSTQEDIDSQVFKVEESEESIEVDRGKNVVISLTPPGYKAEEETVLQSTDTTGSSRQQPGTSSNSTRGEQGGGNDGDGMIFNTVEMEAALHVLGTVDLPVDDESDIILDSNDEKAEEPTVVYDIEGETGDENHASRHSKNKDDIDDEIPEANENDETEMKRVEDTIEASDRDQPFDSDGSSTEETMQEPQLSIREYVHNVSIPSSLKHSKKKKLTLTVIQTWDNCKAFATHSELSSYSFQDDQTVSELSEQRTDDSNLEYDVVALVGTDADRPQPRQEVQPDELRLDFEVMPGRTITKEFVVAKLQKMNVSDGESVLQKKVLSRHNSEKVLEDSSGESEYSCEILSRIPGLEPDTSGGVQCETKVLKSEKVEHDHEFSGDSLDEGNDTDVDEKDTGEKEAKVLYDPCREMDYLSQDSFSESAMDTDSIEIGGPYSEYEVGSRESSPEKLISESKITKVQETSDVGEKKVNFLEQPEEISRQSQVVSDITGEVLGQKRFEELQPIENIVGHVHVQENIPEEVKSGVEQCISDKPLEGTRNNRDSGYYSISKESGGYQYASVSASESESDSYDQSRNKEGGMTVASPREEQRFFSEIQENIAVDNVSISSDQSTITGSQESGDSNEIKHNESITDVHLVNEDISDKEKFLGDNQNQVGTEEAERNIKSEQDTDSGHSEYDSDKYQDNSDIAVESTENICQSRISEEVISETIDKINEENDQSESPDINPSDIAESSSMVAEDNKIIVKGTPPSAQHNSESMENMSGVASQPADESLKEVNAVAGDSAEHDIDHEESGNVHNVRDDVTWDLSRDEPIHSDVQNQNSGHSSGITQDITNSNINVQDLHSGTVACVSEGKTVSDKDLGEVLFITEDQSESNREDQNFVESTHGMLVVSGPKDRNKIHTDIFLVTEDNKTTSDITDPDRPSSSVDYTEDRDAPHPNTEQDREIPNQNTEQDRDGPDQNDEQDRDDPTSNTEADGDGYNKNSDEVSSVNQLESEHDIECQKAGDIISGTKLMAASNREIQDGVTGDVTRSTEDVGLSEGDHQYASSIKAPFIEGDMDVDRSIVIQRSNHGAVLPITANNIIEADVECKNSGKVAAEGMFTIDPTVRHLNLGEETSMTREKTASTTDKQSECSAEGVPTVTDIPLGHSNGQDKISDEIMPPAEDVGVNEKNLQDLNSGDKMKDTTVFETGDQRESSCRDTYTAGDMDAILSGLPGPGSGESMPRTKDVSLNQSAAQNQSSEEITEDIGISEHDKITEVIDKEQTKNEETIDTKSKIYRNQGAETNEAMDTEFLQFQPEIESKNDIDKDGANSEGNMKVESHTTDNTDVSLSGLPGPSSGESVPRTKDVSLNQSAAQNQSSEEIPEDIGISGHDKITEVIDKEQMKNEETIDKKSKIYRKKGTETDEAMDTEFVQSQQEIESKDDIDKDGTNSKDNLKVESHISDNTDASLSGLPGPSSGESMPRTKDLSLNQSAAQNQSSEEITEDIGISEHDKITEVIDKEQTKNEETIDAKSKIYRKKGTETDEAMATEFVQSQPEIESKNDIDKDGTNSENNLKIGSHILDNTDASWSGLPGPSSGESMPRTKDLSVNQSTIQNQSSKDDIDKNGTNSEDNLKVESHISDNTDASLSGLPGPSSGESMPRTKDVSLNQSAAQNQSSKEITEDIGISEHDKITKVIDKEQMKNEEMIDTKSKTCTKKGTENGEGMDTEFPESGAEIESKDDIGNIGTNSEDNIKVESDLITEDSTNRESQSDNAVEIFEDGLELTATENSITDENEKQQNDTPCEVQNTDDAMEINVESASTSAQDWEDTNVKSELSYTATDFKTCSLTATNSQENMYNSDMADTKSGNTQIVSALTRNEKMNSDSVTEPESYSIKPSTTEECFDGDLNDFTESSTDPSENESQEGTHKTDNSSTQKEKVLEAVRQIDDMFIKAKQFNESDSPVNNEDQLDSGHPIEKTENVSPDAVDKLHHLNVHYEGLHNVSPTVSDCDDVYENIFQKEDTLDEAIMLEESGSASHAETENQYTHKGPFEQTASHSDLLNANQSEGTKHNKSPEGIERHSGEQESLSNDNTVKDSELNGSIEKVPNLENILGQQKFVDQELEIPVIDQPFVKDSAEGLDNSKIQSIPDPLYGNGTSLSKCIELARQKDPESLTQEGKRSSQTDIQTEYGENITAPQDDSQNHSVYKSDNLSGDRQPASSAINVKKLLLEESVELGSNQVSTGESVDELKPESEIQQNIDGENETVNEIDYTLDSTPVKSSSDHEQIKSNTDRIINSSEDCSSSLLGNRVSSEKLDAGEDSNNSSDLFGKQQSDTECKTQGLSTSPTVSEVQAINTDEQCVSGEITYKQKIDKQTEDCCKNSDLSGDISEALSSEKLDNKLSETYGEESDKLSCKSVKNQQVEKCNKNGNEDRTIDGGNADIGSGSDIPDEVLKSFPVESEEKDESGDVSALQDTQCEDRLNIQGGDGVQITAGTDSMDYQDSSAKETGGDLKSGSKGELNQIQAHRLNGDTSVDESQKESNRNSACVDQQSASDSQEIVAEASMSNPTGGQQNLSTSHNNASGISSTENGIDSRLDMLNGHAEPAGSRDNRLQGAVGGPRRPLPKSEQFTDGMLSLSADTSFDEGYTTMLGSPRSESVDDVVRHSRHTSENENMNQSLERHDGILPSGERSGDNFDTRSHRCSSDRGELQGESRFVEVLESTEPGQNVTEPQESTRFMGVIEASQSGLPESDLDTSVPFKHGDPEDIEMEEHNQQVDTPPRSPPGTPNLSPRLAAGARIFSESDIMEGQYGNNLQKATGTSSQNLTKSDLYLQPAKDSDKELFDGSCEEVDSEQCSPGDMGSYELVHCKEPEPKSRKRKKQKVAQSEKTKELTQSETTTLTNADIDQLEEQFHHEGNRYTTIRENQPTYGSNADAVDVENLLENSGSRPLKKEMSVVVNLDDNELKDEIDESEIAYIRGETERKSQKDKDKEKIESEKTEEDPEQASALNVGEILQNPGPKPLTKQDSVVVHVDENESDPEIDDREMEYIIGEKDQRNTAQNMKQHKPNRRASMVVNIGELDNISEDEITLLKEQGKVFDETEETFKVSEPENAVPPDANLILKRNDASVIVNIDESELNEITEDDIQILANKDTSQTAEPKNAVPPDADLILKRNDASVIVNIDESELNEITEDDIQILANKDTSQTAEEVENVDIYTNLNQPEQLPGERENHSDLRISLAPSLVVQIDESETQDQITEEEIQFMKDMEENEKADSNDERNVAFFIGEDDSGTKMLSQEQSESNRFMKAVQQDRDELRGFKEGETVDYKPQSDSAFSSDYTDPTHSDLTDSELSPVHHGTPDFVPKSNDTKAKTSDSCAESKNDFSRKIKHGLVNKDLVQKTKARVDSEGEDDVNFVSVGESGRADSIEEIQQLPSPAKESGTDKQKTRKDPVFRDTKVVGFDVCYEDTRPGSPGLAIPEGHQIITGQKLTISVSPNSRNSKPYSEMQVLGLQPTTVPTSVSTEQNVLIEEPTHPFQNNLTHTSLNIEVKPWKVEHEQGLIINQDNYASGYIGIQSDSEECSSQVDYASQSKDTMSQKEHLETFNMQSEDADANLTEEEKCSAYSSTSADTTVEVKQRQEMETVQDDQLGFNVELVDSDQEYVSEKHGGVKSKFSQSSESHCESGISKSQPEVCRDTDIRGPARSPIRIGLTSDQKKIGEITDSAREILGSDEEFYQGLVPSYPDLQEATESTTSLQSEKMSKRMTQSMDDSMITSSDSQLQRYDETDEDTDEEQLVDKQHNLKMFQDAGKMVFGEERTYSSSSCTDETESDVSDVHIVKSDLEDFEEGEYESGSYISPGELPMSRDTLASSSSNVSNINEAINHDNWREALSELPEVVTDSVNDFRDSYMRRYHHQNLRSLSMSELEYIEQTDWYNGISLSLDCVNLNFPFPRTVSNDSITYVFVAPSRSLDAWTQDFESASKASPMASAISEPSCTEKEMRHKYGIDETILPFKGRTQSVEDITEGISQGAMITRQRSQSIDESRLLASESKRSESPDLTPETVFGGIGQNEPDSVTQRPPLPEFVQPRPGDEPVRLRRKQRSENNKRVSWGDVEEKLTYSVSPEKDLPGQYDHPMERPIVVEIGIQTSSSLEDIQKQGGMIKIVQDNEAFSSQNMEESQSSHTNADTVLSNARDQSNSLMSMSSEVTDAQTSPIPFDSISNGTNSSLQRHIISDIELSEPSSLIQEALHKLRSAMGSQTEISVVDSEDIPPGVPLWVPHYTTEITQTSEDMICPPKEGPLSVSSPKEAEQQRHRTVREVNPGTARQLLTGDEGYIDEQFLDVEHFTTTGRHQGQGTVVNQSTDEAFIDEVPSYRPAQPVGRARPMRGHFSEADAFTNDKILTEEELISSRFDGHQYGYPLEYPSHFMLPRLPSEYPRTIETQTWPEMRVMETQTFSDNRIIETQTSPHFFNDTGYTQTDITETLPMAVQTEAFEWNIVRPQVLTIDSGNNPSPPRGFSPIELAAQTDPSIFNMYDSQFCQTDTLDDYIALEVQKALHREQQDQIKLDQKEVESVGIQAGSPHLDIVTSDADDQIIVRSRTPIEIETAHIPVETAPIYSFSDPSLSSLRQEHEKLMQLFSKSKDERENSIAKRKKLKEQKKEEMLNELEKSMSESVYSSTTDLESIHDIQAGAPEFIGNQQALEMNGDFSHTIEHNSQNVEDNKMEKVVIHQSDAQTELVRIEERVIEQSELQQNLREMSSEVSNLEKSSHETHICGNEVIGTEVRATQEVGNDTTADADLATVPKIGKDEVENTMEDQVEMCAKKENKIKAVEELVMSDEFFFTIQESVGNEPVEEQDLSGHAEDLTGNVVDIVVDVCQNEDADEFILVPEEATKEVKDRETAGLSLLQYEKISERKDNSLLISQGIDLYDEDIRRNTLNESVASSTAAEVQEILQTTHSGASAIKDAVDTVTDVNTSRNATDNHATSQETEGEKYMMPKENSFDRPRSCTTSTQYEEEDFGRTCSNTQVVVGQESQYKNTSGSSTEVKTADAASDIKSIIEKYQTIKKLVENEEVPERPASEISSLGTQYEDLPKTDATKHNNSAGSSGAFKKDAALDQSFDISLSESFTGSEMKDEAIETDMINYSDELERLRRERQRILDMLAKDIMPSKLQVELAEAQLNYIIGQTDILLNTIDEPMDWDIQAISQHSSFPEEQLGEISKEYLSRYRHSLEMSKKHIDIKIVELEKKKDRTERARKRTKQFAKMRREAAREAFVMEREREQSTFDRTIRSVKARAHSDSPVGRSGSELQSREATDGRIPPPPISSSKILTPMQRQQHLTNLRRGLVKYTDQERSRSVSPALSSIPSSPRSRSANSTLSHSYGIPDNAAYSPYRSTYLAQYDPQALHSPRSSSLGSAVHRDISPRVRSTGLYPTGGNTRDFSPGAVYGQGRSRTLSGGFSLYGDSDTMSIGSLDEDTQRLLGDVQQVRGRTSQEIQKAKKVLEKKTNGQSPRPLHASPARSTYLHYTPNDMYGIVRSAVTASHVDRRAQDRIERIERREHQPPVYSRTSALASGVGVSTDKQIDDEIEELKKKYGMMSRETTAPPQYTASYMDRYTRSPAPAPSSSSRVTYSPYSSSSRAPPSSYDPRSRSYITDRTASPSSYSSSASSLHSYSQTSQFKRTEPSQSFRPK